MSCKERDPKSFLYAMFGWFWGGVWIHVQWRKLFDIVSYRDNKTELMNTFIY